MDSVYKLTKYSQKITDACQKKQYEKIGLYNKHENLYIKKLNEYFCNQKGGATADDLRDFFGKITDSISDIIKNNKDLTQQLETKQETFDKTLQDYQKEIERLNMSKDRLEDDLSSQRQIIGDLQELLKQKAPVNVQEVMTERDDLKLQLQELKRLMEEKENVIISLKSEVGQLKAENRDLMQEKESHLRQIEALTQELQDKSSVDLETIGHLEQKLESLNTEAQQKEQANALVVKKLTEQLEEEKAKVEAAIAEAAAAQVLAEKEGTEAVGTEVGGGRRRR